MQLEDILIINHPNEPLSSLSIAPLVSTISIFYFISTKLSN